MSDSFPARRVDTSRKACYDPTVPSPTSTIANAMHRSIFRLLQAALVCAAFLLISCAGKDTETLEAARPKRLGPAVDFESPQTFLAHLDPANLDLNSWKELEPYLRNSLRYVSAKPQGDLAVDPVSTPPSMYQTWGDLRRTLITLLDLLPRLDDDPILFDRHFTWIPVPGGIAYSGYYEPVIMASRVRKPGYEHPIYGTPPDMKSHKRRHGSYYDRKAIDGDGVLAGRGLEIAWAADPVDVFFLQIQGSGRLQFDDGTTASINYDSQNGHKYRSSGRIMAAKGLLKHGHVLEQREWFKNNPHRVNEILFENPSYVFFKLGNQGAIGAMGYALAPWASIATDRKLIPLGSVVAYGVNIPDMAAGQAPLRAIGLAQDVGGAIKKNRIDIFCGPGEEGEFVASKLDRKGPAWVLVARPEAPKPLEVASATVTD